MKTDTITEEISRPYYQWPASQLSSEEMAILFRQRKKTGTPITRLLRHAVHIAYGGGSKKTEMKGES